MNFLIVLLIVIIFLCLYIKKCIKLNDKKYFLSKKYLDTEPDFENKKVKNNNKN